MSTTPRASRSASTSGNPSVRRRASMPRPSVASSIPFLGPTGPAPADRGLFDQLRHRPWVCTGQPTSYYTMQATDTNHEIRMALIREFLAREGNATLAPHVLGRERV